MEGTQPVQVEDLIRRVDAARTWGDLVRSFESIKTNDLEDMPQPVKDTVNGYLENIKLYENRSDAEKNDLARTFQRAFLQRMGFQPDRRGARRKGRKTRKGRRVRKTKKTNRSKSFY